MKRLLSLMVASMLIPSTVLASSIRPGSMPQTSTPKSPLCLGEEEKFTEKCDILIDDTGVEGPEGKITNVVQWQTQDKDFSMGGAIVGGAVGTGAGFAAGLGSCMIVGPFCLITAPAIMSTGTDVGVGAGGKGRGKFFTVIGDDTQGNRLIQEWYDSTSKGVRASSKLLLKTTKLAEGEVRD
tara:strand:+ start:119 stop:664 length:546 start_codon:yes stop_codon:yes gene_type:complete